MFGFDKKIDVAESVTNMLNSLNKTGDFAGISDKAAMKYLMAQSSKTASFISDYMTKDSMYIHYYKKRSLHEIIKELNHLFSTSRYYYNYSSFDKNEVLNIISKIQSLFQEYAQYGSMYVFRHCEKAKRTDSKGKVYDGIPTHAIKEQAMKAALEIMDEILISPKKVRIILKHSEAARTKIFGEIILREINYHLHHCKDKIQIINGGNDPRIRFGYFSDKALAEILPVYKTKGEFYSFLNWYLNANEFKKFKLQPKVEDVVYGVESFVKENNKLIEGGDYYTIVIAITHSWIIDAYLLKRIPGLENEVKNVIKTAGFFKVECGQLNYLGKWVES